MSKKYYIPAATDRVGSQLFMDISAMYCCQNHNVVFGGSIDNRKERIEPHIEGAKLLGLPQPLTNGKYEKLPRIIYKFRLFPKDVGNNIYHHFNDFKNAENRWMHDESFIKKLRELRKQSGEIKKPRHLKNKTLTVHIRRGDVSSTANSIRYLPNEYYINAIKKVIKEQPGINIRIHTYGKWRESKDPFIDLGCEFIHPGGGNGGIKAAWADMVFSDYLITSISKFSYIPAIYNTGVVICPDLKLPSLIPLKNWRVTKA